MTTRRLAQKQPSLKECVIAHWSSGRAPTIERGSSAPPKPRTPGPYLGPGVVGERPVLGEAGGVTPGGRCGSEDAGMSSETGVGVPGAV